MLGFSSCLQNEVNFVYTQSDSWYNFWCVNTDSFIYRTLDYLNDGTGVSFWVVKSRLDHKKNVFTWPTFMVYFTYVLCHSNLLDRCNCWYMIYIFMIPIPIVLNHRMQYFYIYNMILYNMISYCKYDMMLYHVFV